MGGQQYLILILIFLIMNDVEYLFRVRMGPSLSSPDHLKN